MRLKVWYEVWQQSPQIPTFFFFLFFFYYYFILFLNFKLLYWFCQISKWIRHGYTCVPHPEPSSLPIPSLWVVPVHQPQASSIVHRTWTGDSFHIWYYTYFNAILPTFFWLNRMSSTLQLLFQSTSKLTDTLSTEGKFLFLKP